MPTAITVPTEHADIAALVHRATADDSPIVVLCHGFTGWKEEAHLETLADNLCEAGITAVRFDAPGSGESTGTFTDDYRLTSYVETVMPVLRFVRSEFDVTGRSGIWGHSMGGFVALHAAVENSDVFAAACGSQPSHGKTDFPADEKEQWRTTGMKRFSNTRFPEIDLPYEFFEDRLQYNLVQTIGDLRMPLLLIAGTRDTATPPEEVAELFAAANEPRTLLEYNTTHFYKANPRILREINEATVEFFVHYLP